MVENFEKERYLGKWYEIARLPNRFEKDLHYVTAYYSTRADGKIGVLNEGRKPDGQTSSAKGKAKFASDSTKGHLKVSFFGPFYADYCILELDPEYRSALIASAGTKYLWILSRTPVLDEATTAKYIARAREMGFPVETLEMIKQ
ncbi:MAG: lipocalin family protein [Verrucomicrobiota bacterium]|nr:lipocalin family protein [Verrucomicrobiota bacterium]